MSSIAATGLLAFLLQSSILQAHAEEFFSKFTNKLDEVVNNFVDRQFKASHQQDSDLAHSLDRTTLGKPASNALSGKVIGDGKYLLCENPQKSSSGKSEIYRGFRSDANKEPTGAKLAIKISEYQKLMSRENGNYDRFTSGKFSESFINKIDFLPQLNSNVQSEFDENCALVMECGCADLKDILKARQFQGLKGTSLRNAAKSAANCIQAMHSAGFVWTDLKPPNFVVMGEEIGESIFPLEVKGLDVESAVPHQEAATDYSLEACPPEFAKMKDKGEEELFKVDYSYDIWSYGMYLYELAMGKSYFQMKNGAQVGVMGIAVVIEIMADPDFRVDVSDVEDDLLRNLIAACLSLDPKRRPSIAQIMGHPFLAGPKDKE